MTRSAVRQPLPSDAPGAAAGAGAYLLWGTLTLYWPLLRPAVPLEILAHRIVWALAALCLLLTVMRRWRWLAWLRAHPAQLALVAAAGGLIAVNWFLYIWAVSSDRVIDAALGYFITPLFNALLGVLVLRERLHPGQWGGVSLAAAGVAWLVVGASGRAPWVSLALATSFSLYGLCKKRVRLGAVESLTVETTVLFVPASAFLLAAAAAGTGTFATVGAAHDVLLMSTGAVTVVPLLLFGTAARRIPLAMLGMLQYLTPTLQFLIGVLVFHEPVDAAALTGYALVWSGLAVFVTTDLLRWRHRRAPRPEPAS